jgi:DNA polymerase-3 subunit delta
MYKRELDQKLRANIPKALMLFGDNEYLLEYYINYYIQTLNAKDDLLGVYYDEWDFSVAKNYLSQTSLFGGKNLLIIKYNKKIPKKELDILVSLANKNDVNYLLFKFTGLPKDAKSMQSSFSVKNGGEWVRFFEPSISEGIKLLQESAKEINLNIDSYALQHLMIVLNNDLSLCNNELKKLAILNIQITDKDIDRLVYSTAPLSTEDFFVKLFTQKPIINMLDNILELGEDELSLLRSTQRFITEMFLFGAYMELNNGYINSIDILGYKLPQQIENKKANLSKQIKPSSLLKISQHLIDMELKIKSSSSMNKESLIFGTFIEIQSILKID